MGEGVRHRLLVGVAEDGREALLGPGRLHQHEQVPVAGEPGQGGTDPLFDPSGRVVLAGDGIALGQAKIPDRLLQDGDHELVLGSEVPVEDALAHSQPVHDGGHRCRVVALGGERVGGHVHELPATPGSSRGEAMHHGAPTLRVARGVVNVARHAAGSGRGRHDGVNADALRPGRRYRGSWPTGS